MKKKKRGKRPAPSFPPSLPPPSPLPSPPPGPSGIGNGSSNGSPSGNGKSDGNGDGNGDDDDDDDHDDDDERHKNADQDSASKAMKIKLGKGDYRTHLETEKILLFSFALPYMGCRNSTIPTRDVTFLHATQSAKYSCRVCC